MFHLKKISVLFIVLFAALFLLCGPAAAVDKTLTVGTASGGIGDTVSIPITINDPTGVGGIAFTITYDPAVFEFMGLQQGIKVLTDGSNTSYSTAELQADLFYQVNDEGAPSARTGRVMVAAASAQALTGTNHVLFYARFKINAGNGPYSIGLVKTIIQNAAAGYTTSTLLPVLVGTTDLVGGKYTSTNFPVYAVTLIPGSITVNAPKFTISGTVTYAGASPGSPAVRSTVVLKRNTDNGYVFDAQTTESNAAAYAFANKPAGTYQVFVTSNDPNYYSGQSAPFAVSGNYTVAPINLQAPQRLTGSVTLNGSGLPGLQVKVMNGSTVVGIYAVNADGSFQTPPLPPGSYTLWAIYGSYSSLITAGQLNPLTTDLYSIGGNITGLTGAQTVTVMVSSSAGKLQKTTTVTTTAGSAAYTMGNLVPASDYIVSVAGSGIPVTYYNQTTDITQATAVNISGGNFAAAHFDFSGVNRGTISGTITENSIGVNIGVYAFETTTYALTQVSAIEGAYTFTLAPGSYEIYVLKANDKIFYYKYIEGSVGATQSETEATILTLIANGSQTANMNITECTSALTGKVTWRIAGGDPAANVLITASSNVGNGTKETDASGAYRIDGLCGPADYNVEMNPLISKYAIQSATVRIPPQAGGTATQNFVIDTGHVLSGKITDSSGGAPIANAMIYLRDQQTGVLANGRMYFSNNTGDYTIADIANGIYNINVAHPQYRSYSESDLSITVDATKNMALIQGYHFDVTVTDGDNLNAALAGALVIVTRSGEISVNCTTDANGNCKIYGLGSTGDYTIMVKKPGFVTQAKDSQTPADGVGTAVSFSLVRPTAVFSLSGTITSDCAIPNPPVIGAYVKVSSETKAFFASATTNVNGYYSMENKKLPQAADYQFTVVPGGNLQQQIDMTNPEFTGIPNDTAVIKNVTIPCGSTITGTVTRTGTAPIDVFLYTAADGFVDFKVADENGTYTFTGLTAGTYKVLAMSSGNTPKWYNGKDTISTADPVPNGTSGVNITLTP